MDTIYQGTTWRRRVTINDTATPPNPVDPTQMIACMCPETPITITQVSQGVYDLSLTEEETAALTAGRTHWEFFGLIGSDVMMLTQQKVSVLETCCRLEVVTP